MSKKTKKFESVVILVPNLSEEEIGETIIYLKSLMNEDKTKVDEIGIKELAYEMKGFTEGYYINFEFKITRNECIKIEDYYRQNANVLKYIILRKED